MVQVQRLLPSTSTVTPGTEAPINGGLFVLSGGMGSLGLMVAEWLTSGASAMWLLGRSGRMSEPHSKVVLELWQSGARTSARRCDLSRREEAQGLVPESDPLCGFVHAGGVLQDAIVTNMTLSQCRAVFAPKVPGLLNMQTGMQMAPVQYVVLFSSIASALGGVGQANYTAANAALDAAAAVQQAQGLTGSSVQWGTWSGGEIGRASCRERV